MSDVFLNADHDIDIQSQKMRLTNETNGEDVAQRIKISLWLFRGEWFFNEDAGVPYFQSIFVKGVTVTEIDNIFKTAIKNVEGVIELLSYSSNFNKSAREFSLDFKVRTAFGNQTLTVVV